jgi:hypothetical protein
MEAVAGSAAYGEAIVFLGCFRDFPDPRQRGKVIYPLQEVGEASSEDHQGSPGKGCQRRYLVAV